MNELIKKLYSKEQSAHRIALFVISFAIYLLTMSPSVSYIDSGELAGAFSTLGVAHPTGYPLFTIISYLWNLLPLGITPIKQLNLLAALLTAISVVDFYNIILILKAQLFGKIDKLEFPSFSFALLYAFGITIWQQSNSVEVYSLHLLLVNAAIYYLLSGVFENSKRKLLFSGMFLGLSFANHLTTVFLVPAFVVYYFYNKSKADNKVTTINNFFQVIACSVPPLFLYGILPIISNSNPIFNWGAVHRSFDKFMYHVQGKQYQSWMFGEEGTVAKNFEKFIDLIPYQLGIVGILLLLPAIYYLLKFNKQLLLFFVILITTSLIYALNYSINDIDTYFLVAFISLISLSFVGGTWLITKYKSIPTYALMILPIINLGMNYPKADRSNDYYVYDYMRSVIDNTEKNSIVISSQWDFWVSAFWYYQNVENYRKDLVVIDKELLRRTWYPNQIEKWYPILKSSSKEKNDFLFHLEKFESKEEYDQFGIQTSFIGLINSYIDKNFDNRNIYVTIDVLQSNPEIGTKYQKIPKGYLIKLSKNYDTIDFDLNKLYLKNYKRKDFEKGSYDDKIFALSSTNLMLQAQYFNSIGKGDKAITFLNKSIELNPDNFDAVSILNAMSRSKNER